MIEIWVPEKWKIESLLVNVADKLKEADLVSDIEEWLCDELSAIECHIANRARRERVTNGIGKII